MGADCSAAIFLLPSSERTAAAIRDRERMRDCIISDIDYNGRISIAWLPHCIGL